MGEFIARPFHSAGSLSPDRYRTKVKSYGTIAQPKKGGNTVKEKDSKMTLEVAEVEFGRFVAEWDIDGNIDAMSGETREDFEQQKNRIVQQIAKGNATVDEKGNVAYTLRHPHGSLTEIKFKIPNGAAYMAMDKYKERQGMHKMYAFMGEATGQAPALFSAMDGRDIKFCLGVTALFLGS